MVAKRMACLAIVGASALAGAPNASAQVRGFVAGGLGANSISSEVTESTPGFGDFTFTTGASNIPALQLEGGARFGSGDVIFGVGLYVQPLTYKADETTGGGVNLQTNVKNLYGLFGEVGWKAAPATVLYGRLSYNQATVDAELFGPGPGQKTTKSENFNGIGFGAGIRHNLSNSMYVFVDWHHVMGNEAEIKDTALLGNTTLKIKPSITTGLIGAGWMF